MERRRSRRSARRKAVGARFKDYIRQFVAFMFSNVGIIGLVVGYTILGALVFMEIEGNESRSWLADVLQERNTTAAKLWNITCCSLNTFSEENWRNEVTNVVSQYQKTIVTAIREKGFDGENTADKWSFAGAFLYSLTVITTIGYGNVTPHTEVGKMITVLYAIIGMPLFLLYLSNIGDILAKSFKWVYAKLCLCRVCPAVRQRRQARAASAVAAAGLAEPVTPTPSTATSGYIKQPLPAVATTSNNPPKVNSWQRDVELGYTTAKTPGHPRSRRRRKKHWDNYPGSYDSEEEVEEEDVKLEQEEEESEDSESSSESSEFVDTVPDMWMEEEQEEELEEEEAEAEESSEDSSEDSYDPQTVTVPLTLCILIMVGYVCGGAALFSQWEEWGILDGSYFCFISLSTIGFGDIVPGDKIYKSNIDLSFIFCAMYLMLGMALIAMCFNLMQEEVISKLRACVRGARYVTRCRGRREVVAR